MAKKIKILTVLGARPQFIKAAALSSAIKKHPLMDEVIVHSGQHYDDNLSGVFFDELDIPSPKYNLGIGSQSHNVFIGRFLIAFDKILDVENPDVIIVFGDTDTTAAAAIAAAKRNICLAHIEAGLREYDKSIPEEVNKLITDSVSDLYFCPTMTGVENLQKQGITHQVFLTGDIGLDLLVSDTRYIDHSLLTEKYGLKERYVFMTCHREANTKDRQKLENILKAVTNLGIQVVFPIHPRTKKAIVDFGLEGLTGGALKVVEPIGFWETQSLIKGAYCTITDSGGIIKETYFHKTPGIIIDTQTEWIETVKEGWNTIAGPNEYNILRAFENLKTPKIHTQALGRGDCGKKIVEILRKEVKSVN